MLKMGAKSPPKAHLVPTSLARLETTNFRRKEGQTIGVGPNSVLVPTVMAHVDPTVQNMATTSAHLAPMVTRSTKTRINAQKRHVV